MLSIEYLLEEAKNNGLPLIKKRGILREYLQVIILNSIYRHKSGKNLYFTGDTALRYFYNMPRFSEDLDFDLVGLKFEEFKGILEYVKTGLEKEGFSPEVISEKRGKLYISEFYFKDLMKLYNVTDKRGLNIMVKIEAYRPSWDLYSESSVLSMYGYNFSSVLLDKGLLFAEKLCALLNRRRGRDIYDTLFMLKKKFPINKNVLTANRIKGIPKDIILEHLRSLSDKELRFLANQVKPFLFKEDDIALILDAVLYAEKFLAEYKSQE